MDIISGFWLQGKYGEYILNGGLGQLNATVGKGNMFKTTILLYRVLRAMARIKGSTGSHYDTEINVHVDRIVHLANMIREFEGEDIVLSGRWNITDRRIYTGDQWYDNTKEFLENKIANGSKIMVRTPFMNRERTDFIEMLMPTFGLMDSITEFITKDVVKMQDDYSLGDSKAQTAHMRQGLQKSRLLMELPGLVGAANHFLGMTAQMGVKIDMDPYNPEQKKLTDIKGNEKLKGVTDKFTFAMNTCLQCFGVAKMINDSTKTVAYPRDSDDDMKGDTDLREVALNELRGKAGPSGIPTSVIVSQRDGVLAELTEFQNIKNNERFGISGTLQHYYLDLLPDVKLSRTTIRGKIDENAALRRALNITSELQQMTTMMPEYRNRGIYCTPKELFDGIKAKGYDWDMILNETRGWWTINNEDHPQKFLSTMDLLNMRVDKYKPYWL